MHTLTTAKSAYRCDTDLLTREILQAAEELFARTAREACRVIVHPLDGRALITAPIGPYGPVVYIGGDGRQRVRGMVVFYEPALPPGTARVEVCDGCLSMWRECENGTRPAADVHGAACLVVDALADLGDEWTRQPRHADEVPPERPREAEAPTIAPVKRTRRPSKRELERRAANAARKAAEAAEKAEQARRVLDESDG